MSRRWFAFFVVSFAVWGIGYYERVGISGAMLYAGIGWFVLACCLAVLAARRVDLRFRSVAVPWSQVAGIAEVALGVGWATAGIGLRSTLSIPTSAATIYEWVWMLFAVFGVWSGVQMLREKDNYRLLERGETMRSRREKVGWARTAPGILKEKAMRSIGVFGMLVVPTFVVSLLVPSVDPAAPITYLPAACLTVVTVACIAWLRVETGAGPMPGQLREAFGKYRTR